MKKNLLPFTAILLHLAVTLPAQAQQHGGQKPLNVRQQQAVSRLNAINIIKARPEANAARPTGTTKERLKALFINYGGGDDSLILYYGSLHRGSAYDYSLINQYDGGYQYLNSPGAQSKFDSLYYITRTDHSSPFEAYLRSYAQYDTMQRTIAGSTDLPDGSGFQPASRFVQTYASGNDISSNTRFGWNTATLQYDSSSQFLNTYFAAGKIADNQNYIWNPNRSGNPYNGRTVNAYNTAGNVISSLYYNWDNGTAAWPAQPANGSFYTFAANGKVAVRTDKNFVNGDSFQLRNSYNSAGQLITAVNYKWNLYTVTNAWDTVSVTSYSFPTATSDWTQSRTISRFPTLQTMGLLSDTIIRSLDAGNQVLLHNEFNDDGSGNIYTVNISNTWYAAGKPMAATSRYIMPEIDTFTIAIIHTYNSYGDPVTRNVYQTDAYGNPAPDTLADWRDHYYYETYEEPDPPLAINEHTAPTVLLYLFPNPARSTVNLSCHQMPEAMMTITNIAGQVLRSHHISLGNEEAVITVADLSPGIYHISLRDVKSGLKTTVRFVKK